MRPGRSGQSGPRARRARLAALALLTAGCAGPAALKVALLPRDEAAYASALAAEPASPKQAFLNWRAAQQSISVDEARRRDEALGASRNPFDANRDRQAVSLGAAVYAAHCLRCHGENVDGRGPDVLPAAPCSDFHAFGRRVAVTLHRGAPRSWFSKIRDGHGPVVSYPDGPSTAMPAFGDKLSNEQIWLAITYLQSIDICVPPEGT